MPPLKNIFFFHGPDTFSSTEKTNHWQKQFIEKYGEFNISNFQGQNLDFGTFKSEAFSLPFGSKLRLVIIKNLLSQGKTNTQKAIAEEISNIPDHTIAIFLETAKVDKRTSLYKKLTKTATTEEFTAPEKQELTKWIQGRLAHHNKNLQTTVSIDFQTTNYLAALVGNNLHQLNQELQKLALLCEHRPMTTADIKATTTPNFSESIFKLTDALGTKNLQKSLKILHDLNASGEEITRTFYMIVRQFRIIIQIQQLQQQGLTQKEIASALKLHPFVVKNTLPQTRNFQAAELKRIYNQILEIEIALKSGKIRLLADNKTELTLAIEKLIMNLCR